jgi:hypothetical protein
MKVVSQNNRSLNTRERHSVTNGQLCNFWNESWRWKQNIAPKLQDTQCGGPQSEPVHQLCPTVIRDYQQFGRMSEDISYEAIRGDFVPNTFRSTLIKLLLHHGKIHITMYCTDKWKRIMQFAAFWSVRIVMWIVTTGTLKSNELQTMSSRRQRKWKAITQTHNSSCSPLVSRNTV